MNKNPITEDEQEKLKAEHRERVRRCTVDLQERYAEDAELARIQKELDEAEWANEGGAGGGA